MAIRPLRRVRVAAGTARGVKGGHWLTTERGWCKAGSIMQVSEGVYYKTTRGDTDHPAYSARSSTSYPDQRGCVGSHRGDTCDRAP